MISSQHLKQTMAKLERLAECLKNRIFVPVGQMVPTGLYQTKEPLSNIPDAACYTAVPAEGNWGGEGVYGWFKGSYTVPAELDGKALFAYPRMTFYEATLWLNGCIHSNFAAKFVVGSHGNHYCNRITAAAKAPALASRLLRCCQRMLYKKWKTT